MVASNRLLYNEDEHPDHVVVIKYVPFVGDSKRAMDEYTSVSRHIVPRALTNQSLSPEEGSLVIDY